MSNNLVERLRTDSLDSRKASISIMDLCMEAACRIESLESALKESEAARSDIGKMLAAAQKELHEVKSELGEYRGKQELSSYSKVVESNEPLTLDELWRIYDGCEGPVWIKIGRSCWPAILDTYDGELVAVWTAAVDFCHEKDYGKTWLAYRQKPEEGTV